MPARDVDATALMERVARLPHDAMGSREYDFADRLVRRWRLWKATGCAPRFMVTAGEFRWATSLVYKYGVPDTRKESL